MAGWSTRPKSVEGKARTSAAARLGWEVNRLAGHKFLDVEPVRQFELDRLEVLFAQDDVLALGDLVALTRSYRLTGSPVPASRVCILMRLLV